MCPHQEWGIACSTIEFQPMYSRTVFWVDDPLPSIFGCSTNISITSYFYQAVSGYSMPLFWYHLIPDVLTHGQSRWAVSDAWKTFESGLNWQPPCHCSHRQDSSLHLKISASCRPSQVHLHLHTDDISTFIIVPHLWLYPISACRCTCQNVHLRLRCLSWFICLCSDVPSNLAPVQPWRA